LPINIGGFLRALSYGCPRFSNGCPIRISRGKAVVKDLLRIKLNTRRIFEGAFYFRAYYAEKYLNRRKSPSGTPSKEP
jgi:hypothetical protein